jgi:hypothetical protein
VAFEAFQLSAAVDDGEDFDSFARYSVGDAVQRNCAERLGLSGTRLIA